MQKRTLGMITVSALFLFGLRWSIGKPQQNDSVIALVNGGPIGYVDLKVDARANILLMRFRSAFGREPQTPADSELLERYRLQYEFENLTLRIRDIVRKQQIKRFGINPTDEEVEERWRRWVNEQEREGKPFDRTAYIGQTRDFLRELVVAYREVMDESRDPDEVYEERFSELMSREEWRLRLEHEATPERRKALENALALPDSKLFQHRELSRKILIMEKLEQAIDRELMRTDPEYAEYIRLVEIDPGAPEVQEKGPTYRDAKRYQWWEDRYREADVEIVDDRFKDAWPPK